TARCSIEHCWDSSGTSASSHCIDRMPHSRNPKAQPTTCPHPSSWRRTTMLSVDCLAGTQKQLVGPLEQEETLKKQFVGPLEQEGPIKNKFVGPREQEETLTQLLRPPLGSSGTGHASRSPS